MRMRNVTQARLLAQVPSASNPSKSYEIRLGGDGIVYCTCQGWKMNKWCKHLESYHSTMGNAVTGLMAKSFEKRPPPILGHHSFDETGVCNHCGCSDKAVAEFGFDCNPSKVEEVIEKIITGKWNDPRKNTKVKVNSNTEGMDFWTDEGDQ